MPTIEISDDLHGLLRRLAQTEDESDADVLRRVLRTYGEDRDAALKAYEASEQDTSSTN
jgi:predicted transcriptional regulator